MMISNPPDDLVRFGTALLRPGLITDDARALFFSDDWFGRTAGDGERFAIMTGSNPGVQASLGVYPDRRTVVAVLSNTWGRGSRSLEMVRLPSVIARICTE